MDEQTDIEVLDFSKEEQNNISKKTGKPKRVLTEKQQEILKEAREKWNEKRREQKAKKMLIIAPRKEKFENDKKLVETELTKLKKDIEEKLKMEYEQKLTAIKEEFESKFTQDKAIAEVKEEIKQKYTRKPKKIIEVYSSEQESDAPSVAPKRPPIANKKIARQNSDSIAVDDDIKKFFF